MSDQVRGNILVVDDYGNWREVLTHILEKEGYHVKTAATFENAVKEFSENKFDLLILDVRLEDEDIFNIQGVELLSMAKNRPDAPKVIMLTGYLESIPAEVLERYKADALLLKVHNGLRFNTKEFKEKVRELFECKDN